MRASDAGRDGPSTMHQRRAATERPTVLAFLPARGQLASLRTALGAHVELRCAGSTAELIDAMRERRPTLVIVAMRDHVGESTAPLIRRLRSEFPQVPLIGYCELTCPDLRAAVTAGSAGVEQLVIQGDDRSRGVLQQVLRQVERQHLVDAVLARTAPFGSPELQWIVSYCLTHVHERGTVEQLAEARGVSAGTLTAALRRDGLPSPGYLVSWCRLLAAADQLGDPTRSVGRIAEELGFASASALRMMLKRYTGLRPRDVRHHGGLPFLAETFTRWLAGHRAGTCR